MEERQQQGQQEQRQQSLASRAAASLTSMVDAEAATDKFLVMWAVVDNADYSTKKEMKDLTSLWETTKWKKKTQRMKLTAKHHAMAEISDSSSEDDDDEKEYEEAGNGDGEGKVGSPKENGASRSRLATTPPRRPSLSVFGHTGGLGGVPGFPRTPLTPHSATFKSSGAEWAADNEDSDDTAFLDLEDDDGDGPEVAKGGGVSGWIGRLGTGVGTAVGATVALSSSSSSSLSSAAPAPATATTAIAGARATATAIATSIPSATATSIPSATATSIPSATATSTARAKETTTTTARVKATATATATEMAPATATVAAPPPPPPPPPSTATATKTEQARPDNSVNARRLRRERKMKMGAEADARAAHANVAAEVVLPSSEKSNKRTKSKKSKKARLKRLNPLVGNLSIRTKLENAGQVSPREVVRKSLLGSFERAEKKYKPASPGGKMPQSWIGPLDGKAAQRLKGTSNLQHAMTPRGKNASSMPAWTKERLIGQGTHGKVYLVRVLDSGKPMAMKEIECAPGVGEDGGGR